jgi:hypothetical protein
MSYPVEIPNESRGTYAGIPKVKATLMPEPILATVGRSAAVLGFSGEEHKLACFPNPYQIIRKILKSLGQYVIKAQRQQE